MVFKMVKKEPGPDQARSWAIAFAGCIINTLTSGVGRTTALFYVAFIDNFKVTRMEANMPFTVRNVVRNLSGPIVGTIGQKYGAQGVTIIGGVFASLGIILCAWAPNIIWITVLWGGMHGFGVALGNTLFQVIINYYFVKYRATASGLALAGACVGAFLLPLLLEYLLNTVGLSGTFLLTGGLILHALPSAILIKEPPWIRMVDSKAEEAASRVKSKRIDIQPPKMMTIHEEANGKPQILLDPSVLKIRNGNSDVRGSSLSSIDENRGFDNTAFEGSLTDLRKIYLNQIPEQQTYRKRQRTLSVSDISLPLQTFPEEDQQEVSLLKGIAKVYREPMFHMISLSLGVFAMQFDPCITIIVDYIIDKGVKENSAKYFISLMSVGDLIGRLCFGWVTDKNYLSVPKFMMLLQILQGLCFILFPMFYTFNALLGVIVAYGLTSGAALVMFPVLIAKYLQSVQSLAIGFITFFTGILSFAVPPLIGYFRDKVGSYDGMFYITGGMSIVVGLLWILEPLILLLGDKLNKSDSVEITA